ncbi:hypothetical protein L208DRAFT_1382212 [Tricholoma matsutake]|nr:hypothetical protein L208DRAFT_1382212 [Tricholoma matsutake 945]
MERAYENKPLRTGREHEKLPAVMQQWYNPTPSSCSQAADLKYNGEAFVQRPDCCVTCDPDPQQSRDPAMVQTWVNYFEELNKKEQLHIKPLHSDGTYHPLEKNMKESLVQMLQHWRGQKWAVIRGWNRFADYGIELLQYLGKIMMGFNELFNEREAGNSRSDDVEMATLEPEETPAAVITSTEPVFTASQSRVHLVLGSNLVVPSPTRCTTLKRHASPLHSMSTKRSRSNKENENIH